MEAAMVEISASESRERLLAFVDEVGRPLPHVRQRENALVYVRGLIEHKQTHIRPLVVGATLKLVWCHERRAPSTLRPRGTPSGAPGRFSLRQRVGVADWTKCQSG